MQVKGLQITELMLESESKQMSEQVIFFSCGRLGSRLEEGGGWIKDFNLWPQLR